MLTEKANTMRPALAGHGFAEVFCDTMKQIRWCKVFSTYDPALEYSAEVQLSLDCSDPDCPNEVTTYVLRVNDWRHDKSHETTLDKAPYSWGMLEGMAREFFEMLRSSNIVRELRPSRMNYKGSRKRLIDEYYGQ